MVHGSASARWLDWPLRQTERCKRQVLHGLRHSEAAAGRGWWLDWPMRHPERGKRQVLYGLRYSDPDPAARR